MIKHLISLGCACNVSLYCKEMGLKRCSMPFDWIFCNMKMIMHIIDDGFKTFLDKSEMFTIEDKRCGHYVYHQQLFNHRNPKDNIDDYNYYVRTAKRFKEVLENKDHKMFVHNIYSRPNYHPFFVKFNEPFKEYNFSNKGVMEFYGYLKTKTKNFTLLVILTIPDQKNAKIEKYKEVNDFDSALVIYKLYCIGKTSGKLLKKDIDDANFRKIINSFEYDLTGEVENDDIEYKMQLRSLMPITLSKNQYLVTG